jgi:hypothetical protein
VEESTWRYWGNKAAANLRFRRDMGGEKLLEMLERLASGFDTVGGMRWPQQGFCEAERLRLAAIGRTVWVMGVLYNEMATRSMLDLCLESSCVP